MWWTVALSCAAVLIWFSLYLLSEMLQWSEMSAPCCGGECVLLLCERACLSPGKTGQHKRPRLDVLGFLLPWSFSLRPSCITEWRNKWFKFSIYPLLLDLLSGTQSQSEWRNWSRAVTWTELFVKQEFLNKSFIQTDLWGSVQALCAGIPFVVTCLFLQPLIPILFYILLSHPLNFPLVWRNVSSERSEARRKLRECTGLVDSLMYIVQSQIDCKDVDNKVRGFI